MVTKYVLLALTNLLAFSGAWFYSFTEADKETGKKILTKWGKIALPVALILLIGGFGLTLYDDHQKAAMTRIAAASAKDRETRLLGTIARLEEQGSRSADDIQAIYELVSVLAKPASTSKGAEIAEIIKTPEIQRLAKIDSEFAATLDSLEQSLGGRPAMLERMRSSGVLLPGDDDDVLTVASLDLRMFGDHRFNRKDDKTLNETREAVLSLLRGLDADIVSVQEIADIALFQSILSELPEYFAVYGPGDLLIVQAVLIKSNRLQMQNPPRFINRIGENSRPIFQRAPIVLTLARDKFKFTMVTFHLKSLRGGEAATTRRRIQILELDKLLDQRGQDQAIILAGRTQVGLDAPEIKPLIARGVKFGSVDLPADSSTLVGKRWGSIVMSHIGGYGKAADRLIQNSTKIFNLETLMPKLSLKEISDRVTDHNPIVTAFSME